MGIDIYALRTDQSTGRYVRPATGEPFFRGVSGFLRESYQGEPYATKFLVSEAFDTGDAAIPAATLRARLPRTLQLARRRAQEVFGWTDEAAILAFLAEYSEFVEFCERAERETGEPVIIIADF